METRSEYFPFPEASELMMSSAHNLPESPTISKSTQNISQRKSLSLLRVAISVLGTTVVQKYPD